MSPELGRGTGRGFALGLLRVWTVCHENWFLHPVLQLLYSTTSGKPFPLSPCASASVILCSSITPLTSATECPSRGCAVLNRGFFFLSLCKIEFRNMLLFIINSHYENK